MVRNRSRAFTFTIHNQGEYDDSKKQELFDHIQAQYPLSGYIIAQELYPNADKTALDPDKIGDSHLQGNLYFKNQVDFHPLLKYLQGKYKETKTEQGLLGRTQLLAIQKGTDTQMDNYFKGECKIGADKNIISDMKEKLKDIGDRKFNNELIDLLNTNQQLLLIKRWELDKKMAQKNPFYNSAEWENPPVWEIPTNFKWLNM